MYMWRSSRLGGEVGEYTRDQQHHVNVGDIGNVHNCNIKANVYCSPRSPHVFVQFFIDNL